MGPWPPLSVIWRNLSSLCSNLIQRLLSKIKIIQMRILKFKDLNTSNFLPSLTLFVIRAGFKNWENRCGLAWRVRICVNLKTSETNSDSDKVRKQVSMDLCHMEKHVLKSSESCQIMHDNLRRLFDSEMTIKQTKELIFSFFTKS